MIRSTATATALVCLALPAAAQITTQDVMANIEAYSRALGASYSASTQQTGQTMQVRQERVLWEIPLGFGTLGYALSDYTMTENADGTVTITYPAPITVTFDLQLTEGDSGYVSLTLGPDDIVTTASGAPGAISYATATGPLRVELTDIVVPDEPFGVARLTFDVDSTETLTEIVEGADLMRITSVSTLGTATSSMGFQGEDGFVSEDDATYAPSRTQVSLGLPPQGASILDLSDDLRAGMYIRAETTSGGSDTNSVSLLDGAVFTRSQITTGSGAADFWFDESGLGFITGGAEMLVDMSFPQDLMGNIGFGLTGFSAELQLPLLASPDPQDFRYVLGLQDLRLGPSIWAMFDPGKVLDRSPFQFAVDIEGSLRNDIEWLDILALEGLRLENEFPVDLISLQANSLSLSALGASFEGDAMFTFDASDTTTYPGFPRPTGSAGFVLSGVNTVLTFLGDQGLIGSDELFGFRMGLGMVTVPGEGTDVQTGRIELTDDGQIIANGQRLR